jgi:hypothetical protein
LACSLAMPYGTCQFGGKSFAPFIPFWLYILFSTPDLFESYILIQVGYLVRLLAHVNKAEMRGSRRRTFPNRVTETLSSFRQLLANITFALALLSICARDHNVKMIACDFHCPGFVACDVETQFDRAVFTLFVAVAVLRTERIRV